MVPFDKVVMNIFDRFSGNAVLLVEGTNGTYDPSTSQYVSTDVQYNIRAMAFDFLPKKDGNTSLRDTLIEEGDKQLLIQPSEKLNGGTPLPRIQPNKDRILWQNKVYKIVTYKEVNPSGSDCMLIEVYLRG